MLTDEKIMQLKDQTVDKDLNEEEIQGEVYDNSDVDSEELVKKALKKHAQSKEGPEEKPEVENEEAWSSNSDDYELWSFGVKTKKKKPGNTTGKTYE